MFREMRRKKQALPDEVCTSILEQASSGVLAVADGQDYPYAVPLSFVYDKNTKKLYFHCATSGHKLDAVTKNPKVSFCIIAKDEVVPEKYTTHFKSVIVFGTIRILRQEAEMRAAIEKLARKYNPKDSEARRQEYIEKDFNRLCMLEMQADHITGKAAVELGGA